MVLQYAGDQQLRPTGQSAVQGLRRLTQLQRLKGGNASYSGARFPPLRNGEGAPVCHSGSKRRDHDGLTASVTPDNLYMHGFLSTMLLLVTFFFPGASIGISGVSTTEGTILYLFIFTEKPKRGTVVPFFFSYTHFRVRRISFPYCTKI